MPAMVSASQPASDASVTWFYVTIVPRDKLCLFLYFCIMIRWIGSFFGLEPTRTPVERLSRAAQTDNYTGPDTRVPTGTLWSMNNHPQNCKSLR